MPRKSSLAEAPTLMTVGDRLVIPVSWRSAEGLQTHLRRGGVATTIVWEPWEQGARLEVWPGVDPGKARAALESWPG
jgi:hypothetical protein